MNREQAENNYRQKFEDFGLSEKFEYIGRDWNSENGRKVEFKCKTCGSTFLSWGLTEMIKGRQKHLLCIKCGTSSDGNDVFSRSKKAKQVVELYLQGLEQTEIAEKLGCTVNDVGSAVKAYGVTDKTRKYRAFEKANAKRAQEAESKLPEKLEKMGFAYIGGYVNRDSKIKVRCLTCNTEYERKVDSVHTYGLKCKSCLQKDRQLQAKKRKQIETNNAYIRNLENQWLRLLNPPKNKKDFNDELHQSFLSREGICEICGKPYTVEEYVKSCGIKYARDNGVCSIECKDEKSRRLKRKQKRTPSNHRHRARLKGVPYESGITLQKLIRKNGLTCAICGKECNPNDHEWSKYAGPTYPSIDHIIPISKGGGHTWNNVQVACMMCNSLKSDKLEVNQ